MVGLGRRRWRLRGLGHDGTAVVVDADDGGRRRCGVDRCVHRFLLDDQELGGLPVGPVGNVGHVGGLDGGSVDIVGINGLVGLG